MLANADLPNRMRKSFYAALSSKDSKYNSVLMTKQKYDSIIEDVKRIKTSKKKESPRDYRIIERYDVLNVQDSEKLIEPVLDVRQNVKMFVHSEELFDVLHFAHLSVSHGGRDKMIKQLNSFYRNVTQAQIKLFLDSCEVCQQKQKSDRRGTPVNPITTSHPNINYQRSGTVAKEVEKKDPIPVDPTVQIKEEPVDYTSDPSTSNNTTNDEFILPHVENSWTASESGVAPQFTLSVASLASPENSDGDHFRKKRKTMPTKITTSNTFVPPATNGLEVRSQSPVYNFAEFSTPGSSNDFRKDQFDVFGEYIAAKLRSLDRKSCAFAQKDIGNIIFEAEMGKYLKAELNPPQNCEVLKHSASD